MDPDAPIRLEPFTPAIIGKKQVANFAVESWPQLGTLYITVFLVGVVAITAWHLIAGRRAAVRAAKAAALAT